jgi:arylformamidase
VIERYGSASGRARDTLGPPLCLAYGESAAETMDVYRAADAAPIHVFLHGGAWRSLSKTESAFPAPCFVAAGAHFVALDFGLLPAITLNEMVDQARRAIAWIFVNAAEMFGGDVGRIYVSGHSSGAHMAACLLTTAWAAYGLPEDVIKGGLCASGIYDLAPVRLSARNAYVKLDAAMTVALSPVQHIDYLRSPIIVAYAEHDSDEFKRQARDFHAALRCAPYSADLLVAASKNHFEIIETLAEPNGLLSRAALAQMGFLTLGRCRS